jgi:hypothetical protein
LLALALRDFEMQRIRIGFGKSRGLGQVKATIADVTFRYPACALGETLVLPGKDRPNTLPSILAGAGTVRPDDGYGLNSDDIAPLPDGVRLGTDDWMEPCLMLVDGQIKGLWRECAKAWQQVVEAATGT